MSKKCCKESPYQKSCPVRKSDLDTEKRETEQAKKDAKPSDPRLPRGNLLHRRDLRHFINPSLRAGEEVLLFSMYSILPLKDLVTYVMSRVLRSEDSKIVLGLHRLEFLSHET